MVHVYGPVTHIGLFGHSIDKSQFIRFPSEEDQVMTDKSITSTAPDDELAGWTRIAIVSGFMACLVYPLAVYVPLPRIAQIAVGASFGPFLVVASVALAHVLRKHRRTPSVELAAICNSLAGALVTAMIIVQLAINYSTAPTFDEEISKFITRQIWDVVLGLDVSFDVFIGLATLLFSLNMMDDPRFGRVIGWAGVFISVVLLIGVNIYFFPDPPRDHGFPEIGLFVGFWYLGVVLLLIRSLRIERARALAVGPAGGYTP